MVLNITDSASLQIKDMLKEEDAETVFLRFGVKGGGCSGLSYSLGFEYEKNEELDTFEVVNDIPVIIRSMDIPVIDGTTIDFKQNMMGGGFTIDNRMPSSAAAAVRRSRQRRMLVRRRIADIK